MGFRLSTIAASIRRVLSAVGIGGAGDYYWDKVVFAMSMNNTSDSNWANTSAAFHMDEQDPYWSSTVLAMHMDDDPYWSSVVLAMHMDGADSGTTFTDVKGKTVTPVGNAQTKTATKKFGTASAYFDGTGDCLTIPNSTAWVLSYSAFTIEAWIYIASNSSADASGNRRAGIFGISDVSVQNLTSLFIDGNSTTTGTGIVLEYKANGVSNTQNITVSIQQSKWHHIAICSDNGVVSFFLNGMKLPSLGNAITTNIIGTSVSVHIGRQNALSTWERYFNGYIDDLRVTNGVCRYKANFYPSQRAFAEGVPIDEKGKAITLVGNAALSTTQKKFGVSSIYFDGTGDYATTPHSTDFDFGSGDFTIEAWIYPTVVPSVVGGILSKRLNAGVWSPFNLTLLASRAFEFSVSLTGSSWITLQSSPLTLNTWTHVACVRTGNTILLFINGTLAAINSTLSTTALMTNTNLVSICATDAGAEYTFTGYIDDLRITKGVARYTSNFVPSPVAFHDPVTAPTFMDEKGNIFLATGTPTLTATNAKFGGMSASFNGTTDYLTTQSALSNFGFANGDFTVEAWVRTAASGTIVDTRSYATDLGLFAINSGKASIWNRGSHLLGATDLTTSTWFHLAWVRKAGVVSLYVNGKVEVVSASNGDFGVTRLCRIGADYAGANFFSGLLDDVRITKGFARYTGEFTPTNYACLDPYNKPMFVEETGKSVAAYGNVVTTTPFKYGDAAASFDGTGDYLTVPDSTDLRVGATSPFTVELWANFASLPSNSTQFNLVQKGYSAVTTSEWQIILVNVGGVYYLAAVTFVDGVTAVTNLFTFTPTIGVWYHLALVRDETNLKLYKDGVQIVSVAGTSLFQGSGSLSLGANPIGGSPFNGSIDDLRITKGLARYLSNFTPPSKIEPYQKTHNTDPYFNNIVLGMHMDGADAGTSFPELTGKTVSVFGNAQTKTATKKFGTASAYFDGNSDYLTVPDSSDFEFGSGDFTVEFWVYPTELSVTRGVLAQRGATTPNDYWGVCIESSTVRIYGGVSGSVVYSIYSTNTLPLNSWSHVAISRDSGTTNIYINGVGGVTGTQYSTFPSSGDVLTVGVDVTPNTNPFIGYIDDLRITKGVARYTANFLPVQAPFPDFSAPLDVQLSDPYWDNVVLALHMDGADNGTTFTDVKGKSVTRVGEPVTKTATKKFGTASAYFDGVNDYLSLADSDDWHIGSGAWTVEFWVLFPAEPAAGSFAGLVGQGGATQASSSFNIYVDNGSRNVSLRVSDGTNWTWAGFPGAPVPLNQWTHMAVSFDIANGKIYTAKNGLVVSYNFTGSIPNVSSPLYIGNLTYADYFLNAYIDDLRITKGVARYTSNFNPPGVFPEKYPESDGLWTSTVLAMHMDGANNGTTFTDQKGKTVTPVGNVATKTAVKKFGTASAYFDGTGDYLTVPSSTDFDFGSGDFTIEMWVYPTSLATLGTLINKRDAALELGPFQMYLNTSGTAALQLSIPTGAWEAESSAPAVTLNQWNHIAAVRIGTLSNIAVNGVFGSSVSITGALETTTAVLRVGGASDGTYPFTGYIDDLQIIKGAARYKENFTPPVRTFVHG